jgi:hypothetical protein
LDALYRRTGFQSDRERVEHLFMLYEKLANPLLARTGKGKRWRGKRRSAIYISDAGVIFIDFGGTEPMLA